MSISMKTLTDKTPSHISEMLIQGSMMGIIDATKNIKKYSETDKEYYPVGKQAIKDGRKQCRATQEIFIRQPSAPNRRTFHC